MANSSPSAVQLADTSYAPLRQHNFDQATLLVVEDREDSWTLLRFALTKYFPDVAIRRTLNRRDTVAYISECISQGGSLPKLILQDLYLPNREDGFRLLEDMRALLHQQQQIPVLVISVSVDEEDIQRAYQRNASYYIVKPMNMSNWLNLCRSIREFWWEQGVLPINPTPKK